MHKIRKAAGRSGASASGFANRDRSGRGRRHETRAMSTEAFAWSARRAGTPEAGETCVVVLITQRRLERHGPFVCPCNAAQPAWTGRPSACTVRPGLVRPRCRPDRRGELTLKQSYLKYRTENAGRGLSEETQRKGRGEIR